MNPLTDDELIGLIENGELDRVEFKVLLPNDGGDAIREAICAFANDLPGYGQPGVLFVGVGDDRTIVGIPVTDQLLRQLGDLKYDGNIVPPPTMTVDKRTLQGKDVAVVTVEPSFSPPVRHKGVVQIRTGPRRGSASIQDERVLNERRRHGDIPYDVSPVPSATLDDLNTTQFINEYLPQAFSPEILEANDRSVEDRLATTKMIVSDNGSTPTVLGLLVLGKDPLDFLPGAYVQFLRIDGKELSDDIVDSEEVSGTIFDVLRRLDEKLQSHNRRAIDLTTYDTERQTQLYPIAALQQLVRNAVLHRSYEATNAPARVYWFSDRIEIHSPGGPFGTVTTERFGQPGITDYRNPNLADAMKTLGFVQRFGVGIATARNILAQAGHPEPEFEVTESNVLVTVRTAQKPEVNSPSSSKTAIPVLTFFNNKGGVGKTSLVYHLSWMLSEMGYRVLACDLDPQANLTSAFLDEDRIASIWDDSLENSQGGRTIMQCVQPLMRVGDIRRPELVQITDNLNLIPGDLSLAGFEDTLSNEWPNALGSSDLYRSFRILTAFATAMQEGAAEMDASVILADVGPNLGAINRSALIATNFVIVPLGADLFSLQGLRNLGPTLARWRQDWQRRKDNWTSPDFRLPSGMMQPIGYVVQQHSVRMNRPVRAYDMWINRMPEEYARNLLSKQQGPYPTTPSEDEHSLATVKHYRSLVPMAMEVRKPIFNLTTSDGAIGSHATAATGARSDFRALAEKIIERSGIQLQSERR